MATDSWVKSIEYVSSLISVQKYVYAPKFSVTDDVELHKSVLAIFDGGHFEFQNGRRPIGQITWKC